MSKHDIFNDTQVLYLMLHAENLGLHECVSFSQIQSHICGGMASEVAGMKVVANILFFPSITLV